jgi:RNA polymerase sigma factor (sigma-70 family)
MYFKVKRIDCEELYPRLIAGDLEARNKVIESHIPLGMQIIKRIHHKYKRDLIPEMTYHLTMAVQRICEGALEHYEEKNISGYLYTCMWGQLIQFAKKEHKRKHITACEPPTIKWFDHMEYQEILDKFDGRERQILEMRIEGYKDIEIGEKLGLTKQRVHQLREGIKSKLEGIYDRR